MSIKVIVAGFKGRMGSAAVNMVKEDKDLTLAGLLDPFATETEVDGVPVFTDKSQLVGFDADVWVDFTMPSVAYENTRFALENGFAPVVGTTGFSEEEIAELIALSEEKKTGGLIAPNFAIGAILLMEFAAKAAKYFPDVEIIELHHDKKKDAPSGTAVKTAELIREVRQPKKQGAADEVELIGPCDATIVKINDRYRRVMYLKKQDYDVLVRMKNLTEAFLKTREEFKKCYIAFDFNPTHSY